MYEELEPRLPRDFQRTRAYRAEDEASCNDWYEGDELSIEECRTFASEVLASPSFIELHGPDYEITVESRRRNSGACAIGGRTGSSSCLWVTASSGSCCTRSRIASPRNDSTTRWRRTVPSSCACTSISSGITWGPARRAISTLRCIDTVSRSRPRLVVRRGQPT